MGRRSDENSQKVVIVHALDRLCLLAGNGQSQVCSNLDCQCSHGASRQRSSQKLLQKDQTTLP